MHDGMPCDPMQGQGHRASEVPKIGTFQGLSPPSPPPFTMGAGK